MIKFSLAVVLTLALPSTVQPALSQDGHDALNRMPQAVAVCILEVPTPLDQDGRNVLAESEMDPDKESGARIDAMTLDMGAQFQACAAQVEEDVG